MRNIPHRRSALILLLLLPAGCISTAPVPETIYSACHVLGSSDWKAQVEFSSTASPIPYVTRRLVVTGKVTTAGGYHASIDQGRSAPREPVQQSWSGPRASGFGRQAVIHNVRASSRP